MLDELKLEGASGKPYVKSPKLTEDPELAHRRKRRPVQQYQCQVCKTLYESIYNSIRAQVTNKHLDRLHFMDCFFKTELGITGIKSHF